MRHGIGSGWSAPRWGPGLLAAVLALTACETAPQPAAAGNNVCERPAVGVALPAVLRETSGVTVSRVHDGIVWTHNDSGGEAAVFAVDSTGAVRARVVVRDASNRDWEDIAAGPCDPGAAEQCLFIGETGDNDEKYPHVAVYRVPEPDPATDTMTAAAEIFRATYPDGPRDAEGLFVTEAGIHIVNKGRSDAIELFRLRPPYRDGSTIMLQRVQQLAPPPTSVSAQVTAAAADPAGERAVLRTYSGLRFFDIRADTLRARGRPADIVAPRQMQGEAVDFLEADRFVMTGEAQGRYAASLAIVACDPLRPPPDTADGGD